MEEGVSRLDAGLVLRHFRIPSPMIAARGRRLIFISDLHYCGSRDEERRISSLAAALRGCRAEAIMLGGDMVGDACHLRKLPAALEALAGCAPVRLAIPGNWEGGKVWLDTSFWRDLYGAGGFDFLSNETREFSVFSVYGSEDLLHGNPAPPPDCASDGRYRILLAHRPDAVLAFDSGRRLELFHLALCGHTHGGQWRLPGLGALFVPSFYRRRFDCGWFKRRNRNLRMFVSCGAGELSLPWRINCRREAVLIELS